MTPPPVRWTLAAATAAGGAMLAPPVAAQAPRDSAASTRLAAVVVTAARREQRLQEVVVPTEVIARADIERSGATDVGALLTQFTGIQLDGGVGGGIGAQLQGLDSRRVLVLLDGQPLVGRVNGDLDLSRLPLAGVERIEVVKGPQSTLYGSEAIGGVINIITRRPAGPASAEATAVGGSRGRVDGAAGGRATHAGWRLAGDASWRATDLAVGIPGDLATRSERWTVTPSVERPLTNAWTARASGLLSEQTQRYRIGQLFRFVDDQQIAARAGAEWRRGAHRVSPVVYLSRFDHLARASTGPRPVAGSGDRDVQTLVEVDLAATTVLRAAVLDAGVEARHERITADRVSGRRRRLDAVDGYVQATVARGPVTVVPGFRATVHSQFGAFAAPRVAALWRPREALAVRASVGRGFRAPDFKELSLSFVNTSVGYAVTGNPHLRPESSTNLQLGLEWSGKRAWWRGGAFDNRFHDFIATGPQDVTGTFTFRNIDRGTTRGLEFEGGWAWGAWRADAGYAYLEARDGEGRPLPARPAHSGRAALTAPLPRHATLAATGVVTGRAALQVDESGRSTATQPTFARLDLKATVPLARGLALLAGLDNALDRRMGDGWPGFTGRLAYGGVTWRAP